MSKKNDKFNCLLTVRKLNSNNKNKSLGITFPVGLVERTDLSPGKYICDYEKLDNGKWKLSVVLDSIWEENDG